MEWNLVSATTGTVDGRKKCHIADIEHSLPMLFKHGNGLKRQRYMVVTYELIVRGFYFELSKYYVKKYFKLPQALALVGHWLLRP